MGKMHVPDALAFDCCGTDTGTTFLLFGMLRYVVSRCTYVVQHIALSCMHAPAVLPHTAAHDTASLLACICIVTRQI